MGLPVTNSQSLLFHIFFLFLFSCLILLVFSLHTVTPLVIVLQSLDTLFCIFSACVLFAFLVLKFSFTYPQAQRFFRLPVQSTIKPVKAFFNFYYSDFWPLACFFSLSWDFHLSIYIDYLSLHAIYFIK